MQSRLFSFLGGATGDWRVTELNSIVGETLPTVSHVDILPHEPDPSALARASWHLRGITSNERYVTRPEKEELTRKQPGLGRCEATRAALIPIRKSAAWWALPQDERRRVFEEQSNHVRTGLQFLPAIARRLHHCRDLSGSEPFDFLTWFEFAPSDAAAFDDLLAQLRRSPEWAFVTREVDIRLEREPRAD